MGNQRRELGGGGSPRWVHVFINIVSCVVEWERCTLCIFYTLMLCLVVWMGLVHMERRWRHVSASCNGQKLYTPLDTNTYITFWPPMSSMKIFSFCPWHKTMFKIIFQTHKYITYNFWTWWSLYKFCIWPYMETMRPLTVILWSIRLTSSMLT